VAVIVNFCPALYHPLDGTNPNPDGLTLRVSRYCFWKVAV